MDATTAVGGPAAVLADYQHATSARMPIVIVALALATALLLGLLLRSLLIPAIGVLLNLLAVAATLGLMDRFFTGSHPLLGGPGQLDATALATVFAVMFALSTDYQVFVVTRVREELRRGGDPRAAVATGLARTARVVSGAALSMVVVFLSFGLADVASLRQFGVGLALAVVLDATLIRLVLLPALLVLAGHAGWWPGHRAPARGSAARRRQPQNAVSSRATPIGSS
jgi:RND superfamily putative drug exporter